MGLFDNLYGDPNQAGLFGLAQGLLQAGGPQRVPIGFAGALGQGLQGGMQAAQAAQTYKQQQALQAMHQQLIGAQIGNYGSEDMARKAQMAETQRKAADQAGLEQTQKDANDFALAELAKRRMPPAGAPNQNDVTATIGNPTADPQYHELLSQFYSKKGHGKLAIDSAKEAMALRKEIDSPPKTQMISISDKQEQLHAFNPQTHAYDIPMGKPRPIFNPESAVTVNNYPNPMAVVSPVTKQPILVQFDKHGGTKESPYLPLKDSTDTERIAAGFHDRMMAAEQNMAEVGTSGYPSYGTNAAAKLGGTAERLAMSKEQQRYRQAQEDWVRAKLRKESGATIRPDEMDSEIATYFPRVGDTKEVIQQKDATRKIATDAMKRNAGRASAIQNTEEDPLGIRKK